MRSYGRQAQDMRTAGRQFAQDKRNAASRRAISDAEDAVISARGAYYYETAPGTPERDAAYDAMQAAEAALLAIDPENGLFS